MLCEFKNSVFYTLKQPCFKIESSYNDLPGNHFIVDSSYWPKKIVKI